MADIGSLLRKRGLLHDISDEEAINSLEPGTRFYFGIDPTAKSLQLGNLVALRSCIRLIQNGFEPIILIGGATGSIGDPSGKSKERVLLSEEQVEINVKNQKKQILSLFDSLNINVEFVNNLDWTKNFTILDFFRDIGKHFSLSYMLQKETVKSRVDSSGISYTEFSYMLLQAFDFYHLYEKYNCKLQVGGSDQWGNITAGLELIRRKIQGQAYALSFPLLLNKNGKKFGKTEEGTLWLDPDLTSPYELHQFLLNTDDDDVINLINIFTDLTTEEIEDLKTEIKKSPEKRVAQKILADSVVELVHGEQAVNKAKASAKVLFGGSIDELSDSEVINIFKDVPSWTESKSKIEELTPIELFQVSGQVKSKGDAKRLLKEGGLYINNERLQEGNNPLKNSKFLERNVILLRTGKKKYRLITVS